MKKTNSFQIILALFFLSVLLSELAYSKEYLSPEELEKWFNSDEELPTDKVNEGKLKFINNIDAENIFRSTINISIDQESIEQGWTTLSQCYTNLDPISLTAIVYRKKFIKNIEIISSKNIKNTKVSGQKIILNDVSKNAKICIKLNSRNFYQNEDKSFSLVNGPYHRKFFDGYFPYHLTLNIKYDPSLNYHYSIPKQQMGFSVTQNSHALKVNTLFEGKLKTEFRFNLIN